MGESGSGREKGITNFTAKAFYHKGAEQGKEGKKRHLVRENNFLIQQGLFCILRAMIKIVVLLVSILWASLVLISWGGTNETGLPRIEPAAVERSGP
jgi:hypothetical protein